MNIMYLCDEYPPGRHGGIGTCVQLLAREMVKLGHTVVVAGFYDWGYGGEDEFIDEGVKVYRFRRGLASGIFKKQDAFAVKAVYKFFTVTGIFQYDIKASLKKYGAFLESLVSAYAIDIAEVPDYHDYMRFCRSYVEFPILKVPVVLKLHGGISYFLKEAGKVMPDIIYNMEKQLYASADAVISISQYTLSKYILYFTLDKPVTIIYNGIKIPKDDVIVEKKITGKVVFTGTLIEKKGIFQLLKAWNIVNEKLPYATLWIFGKGDFEEIATLCKAEAKKSIIYKGHVPGRELFEHLCSAEAAVFPSFAESFALAPMEAMACRTATINTTRTSGPELIDNRVDGILIDPANIDDIANAVMQLLNDIELRNVIADNGSNKIKEKFNISIIAGQHEQYYEQVLSTNLLGRL